MTRFSPAYSFCLAIVSLTTALVPVLASGQTPTTSPGEALRYVIQSGHSDALASLEWSPDGARLLSSSLDLTSKVWDVRTGTLLASFEYLGGAMAPTWSPDSSKLSIWGADGSLRIVDSRSGAVTQTLTFPSGKWIGAAAWSPDGTKLLAASDEGDAFVLDSASGEQLFQVELAGIPLSVAWSPDDVHLAVVLQNGDVELRTAAKGELVTALQMADGVRPHSASWSPVGDRLAVGTNKGAQIWSVASGTLVASFADHRGPVVATSWSPDGTRFLSPFERDLHRWDTATGVVVSSERLSNTVSLASYSPDGRRVAAVARGAGVLVWGEDEAMPPATIEVFKPFETSADVAWSPDGTKLASASGERVHIWDLGSVGLDTSFERHRRAVTAVAWSPDGKQVASASEDATVRVWYADRPFEHGLVLDRHRRAATAVTWSPDGDRIATGGANGMLFVWDASNGALVHELDLGSGVWSLSWSPDGRRLTVPVDRSIWLVDPTSGAVETKLEGHTSRVDRLAWSRDGRLLASGSNDGTLHIWDGESGEVVRSLAGPGDDFIISLAWSADDTTLVAGGEEGVRVWDVETAELRSTFEPHTDITLGVDWHPTRPLLASAGYDRRLTIWDPNRESSERLILGTRGEEWLVYAHTREGFFFDASTDGDTLLSVVDGITPYRVDQLALEANRPDRLMAVVGSHDADLEQHYRRRYERRLGKLRPEPAQGGKFHIPETSIRAGKQVGGVLHLDVELQDRDELSHYQVYVNDVPLYPGGGKGLDGGHSALRTIEVELAPGLNTVEVSATNALGLESHRAFYRATIDSPDESAGDLYYVGFGVSDYANDELDLAYAHKDALDLARVFGGMGHAFDHVYTRTFVDAEATKSSLDDARALLSSTRVEDTVVLFIAGHGVYDRSSVATYYFLTHEAELENLATTAPRFDEIESLLAAIPARNKLFLMDTCESGELSEDAYSAIASPDGQAQARSVARGVVADWSAGSTPARAYLHQRDRYIYNDITRRTGAIVFSSSRGGELSYETPSLENGFFTEAVIEALTSQVANPEGDADEEFVSSDELRAYVSTRVGTLSGGLQNPTVDRDNLYTVLRFPVVPTDDVASLPQPPQAELPVVSRGAPEAPLETRPPSGSCACSQVLGGGSGAPRGISAWLVTALVLFASRIRKARLPPNGAATSEKVQ